MNPNKNVYTKASFFKCALQVNPFSYIEYRGQEQQLSESEYNNQLLSAALEADIKIIGLADHGSVDGFDAIKELFSQNNIVVFPGFEIASSEKVHFVCLFDESTTSTQLTMYLGGLKVDLDNTAAPVELASSEIIKYVNDQGGFVFAAHCTNDDGVLKKRMNNIWLNPHLLAAQIPGSIEDLKGVESDFYRRVILNKDPNYERERKISVINSADVSTPEDIKKIGASCLIKMTKPCFSSFKQAFLDAGSRVRLHSDFTVTYASAIEKIKFVGGYLDEVDIELSDHLNAVIGGRGTGKSTLIECIRFALNLEPFGLEAKRQHESIIKSNLGSEKGIVEVTIRSAAMHGRRFVISRRYGDDAIVTDDQGNISPHYPRDLLPNIELYGQNEIYDMTRKESSRTQLIKRFLKDSYEQFDEDIAKCLEKLKDNRESIIRVFRQKDDIEQEVEKLPKLKDRVEQYKKFGIDDKLEIIPKLEKEKQINSRISAEIELVESSLGLFKENIKGIDYLSDDVISQLPHSKIFESQRGIVNALNISLLEYIEKQEISIKDSRIQIEALEDELVVKINEEDEQLKKTFKGIPSSHGKSGSQIGVEYQDLLTQIEKIQPKQEEYSEIEHTIKNLYSRRQKLLLELSQLSSLRASAMQKLVKRLTNKLSKKVQLKLVSEGDRQALVDFLNKCNLDKIGERRLEWVKDQEFSPANLAATIRKGEQELKNKFSIVDSIVRAFGLLPESKLLELEEFIIPDTMSIDLNVTHDEEEQPIYRSIEDLSTGQQCTAVLHLLLLENNDPLILDQPEDNLDNAFIADRIVHEVRDAKLTRQFLFATHNANIPVFGDAEWIGVLSVEENKGKILTEQQGAIDVPTVQKLAAKILEGGETAFNIRREKYGFS
ncbi:TrlF family AAA-like ATPase [Psychrobacter sp. Ps3]|uniref:TrlF family AAA-like ATPase n=1 Tax=Psychrobacter sp. Ps3 TaxID=2790957 RepID=UPI001EDD2361|nr:AAA family ATPase [Psychrobacter sp. Ps3]MCG3882377.1 AAA family ATPase [Psychrobacter sp. Ps3]